MASATAEVEGLTASLRSRLKSLARSSSRVKRAHDDSVSKQSGIKRLVALIPGGRVSRIHLQEATERFITLSRLVDHYKSIENSSKVKRSYLEGCEDILKKIKQHYLTRREESLNYAWRELTRVHVTICDNILRPDKLPQQVDACREEAHRLAITNDPEVTEMLQQLAESLDESGQDNGKAKRVRRLLRALLERYNTIRTDRIHKQFLDIRTYKISVLILMIISVIMISNVGLLVQDSNKPTDHVQTLPSTTQTQLLTASTSLEDAGRFEPVLSPSVLYQIKERGFSFDFSHPLRSLEKLFEANVLAFVYLAGLTGGFFSVATRVRNQNPVPGEDAYVCWYVLTKPVVGALGAMLLYVLFQSGFVNLEMIAQLDVKPTAEVFGFAFLAGFSERIVFPNLR